MYIDIRFNWIIHVKVGPQLIVGSGGNSYFIGKVDSKDKLYGQVVYLYPCLSIAIVGTYKAGKFASGNEAREKNLIGMQLNILQVTIELPQMQK